MKNADIEAIASDSRTQDAMCEIIPSVASRAKAMQKDTFTQPAEYAKQMSAIAEIFSKLPELVAAKDPIFANSAEKIAARIGKLNHKMSWGLAYETWDDARRQLGNIRHNGERTVYPCDPHRQIRYLSREWECERESKFMAELGMWQEAERILTKRSLESAVLAMLGISSKQSAASEMANFLKQQVVELNVDGEGWLPIWEWALDHVEPSSLVHRDEHFRKAVSREFEDKANFFMKMAAAVFVGKHFIHILSGSEAPMNEKKGIIASYAEEFGRTPALEIMAESVTEAL